MSACGKISGFLTRETGKLKQPWTVACQATLSMEFSRRSYWCWLPFLSPGDLPDPEIEPSSPELQADSLLTEPPGKPVSKWL